jgi:hypothetical protein
VHWFVLCIGLIWVLTNAQNKPILKTNQYSNQSNTQNKPIHKTNQYSNQSNTQNKPKNKTNK